MYIHKYIHASFFALFDGNTCVGAFFRHSLVWSQSGHNLQFTVKCPGLYRSHTSLIATVEKHPHEHWNYNSSLQQNIYAAALWNSLPTIEATIQHCDKPLRNAPTWFLQNDTLPQQQAWVTALRHKRAQFFVIMTTSQQLMAISVPILSQWRSKCVISANCFTRFEGIALPSLRFHCWQALQVFVAGWVEI